MYIEHARDTASIEVNPLSKLWSVLGIAEILSPFGYLLPNMTIKSAGRLVDILEALGFKPRQAYRFSWP